MPLGIEDVDMMNKDIWALLPFGMAFFTGEKKLQILNDAFDKDLYMTEDVFKSINHLLRKGTQKKVVINTDTYCVHLLPIQTDNRINGILIVVQPFSEFGDFGNLYQSYKELSTDLKTIFDSSYDVIYVSDATGTTLRVSSACEWLWGKKQSDLIGKNVKELEMEGIYKPSVTRLVLEKGEKISTIQTTSTGRRLMVVGTPIKDEHGNVIRVVNASRDITEVSQLQEEINEMKRLINGYKQELLELRKENLQKHQVVFKSNHMEKVFDLASRVAQVDSTVLILGESGVGKEVIANHIHLSSQRDHKPFIKINCGAIPENLLESELFGYEKGAFTGANREGKMGLFESANEGTLFLDEIGEMSLQIQVKLLRVLQEQEITRIGGLKPVKVNVRIITATNRDLKEEMKKGTFREDLYYRLNVIPLHIPPLRKRREDVLPFIFHFIDHFNQKYLMNKSFSSRLLDLLQQYDWPGNVRELQNVVERLMVMSDEEEVTSEYLTDILISEHTNQDKVQVLDILPLKECVELAERQLLKLAREKFKSTVQIAKALDVNQSTISRKLNKLESS